MAMAHSRRVGLPMYGPCPAHGATGPVHGGITRTMTLTMTTRCCFGLCFSYLMPTNQRRHDEADDDYDMLFRFLLFSDLMPTNQRKQKARNSNKNRNPKTKEVRQARHPNIKEVRQARSPTIKEVRQTRHPKIKEVR